MTNEKKESRLSITTSADGVHSSVELRGSGKQHFFNLTLLTRDICKVLEIPPFIMVHALLESIDQYEKTGKSWEAIVDVEAIKRGGGGSR